jgi:hypothetical protein
LSTGVALALALTGAAVAQTTTTTTTHTTLSPEQRTTISRYVVQQNTPSVAVQGFEVVPGAVLPPSVSFYSVPQVSGYEYTVVNNQRIIVDPTTRRVVEVVRTERE